MGLVLKHVVLTKAGTWHFRRRLPRDVAARLKQGEFKRLLGTTEREALRHYPKVNAEFERVVADARRRNGAASPAETPLEIHRMAERRAQELASTLVHIGERTLPASDPEAAALIRDSYLSSFPYDDSGDPVGVPEVEGRALAILSGGGKLSRPVPTIEDARKLYLKERVGGDAKKTLELDRIFKLVSEALQSDRTLVSLKREDAKEVRDHMLDGRKASSVHRYLNVVRAAINHAIREFDMAGVANPFMYLEAAQKDKAEPDRDKRRSFATEELKDVTGRILALGNPSLQRIWQILEGTGCRLAEVAGLRVSDVHLDHAIPHITVEWHDERRIKNAVSRRKVPLVGTALDAAKEAVKAAVGQSLLFPAYGGRANGPGAASAALGKHVRAVVPDQKVTTHSLRHLMKDRLRLAGVSKADQDIVLGHSSGSVGEDYGGADARLKVAERALKAALGVERKA
ncbi:integrase [Mesorhizobium sp. M1A.T.Ca.IN.004.03.1.1]|uniref:site-specific integrase n=1 Tax=Mesorhizobium sp. M1A.T.Ca.IN.004.03.1.1 TaxID=2496795 RepID=UPI000FCBF244|nr:site-specific integrase [Mesorhizobium sp. M1A.T.Ca.IN.004.03.1.1]RUV45333.1 integrase [Mesorhizobium sp. M1A.T.Ca.IN.004.03.1.1]